MRSYIHSTVASNFSNCKSPPPPPIQLSSILDSYIRIFNIRSQVTCNLLSFYVHWLSNHCFCKGNLLSFYVHWLSNHCFCKGISSYKFTLSTIIMPCVLLFENSISSKVYT